LIIPDRRTLLALLGLSLVSQLGGYLALTYALGHLPATITSVSLLSQGPLTAVLAALLLGEPLTRYQIAGGVLVLLGVGLANHLGQPENEVNAAFGETADAGALESNAGDEVAAYTSKKVS
jgi:drug/metabolite transporter (DMT)-like permease